MELAQNRFYIRRRLICQVPVIHFQQEQAGATLRATEMKPKLDRFLHRRFGGTMPESWYSRRRADGTGALDYKLRLTAVGEQQVLPAHRLFYANLGDGPERKQILGDCALEILCLIPELQSFLEANLDDFFVVTNFGAMSGKGFGGYVTEKALAMSPEEIGQLLREETGARDCFGIGYYKPGFRNVKNKIRNQDGTMGFEVRQVPCHGWEFALDDIQRIYSAMKQKFLLRYFRVGQACGKELGNEKTRLQELGISPALGSTYLRHRREEYRYVRALLGLCEQMDYIQELDSNFRPVRDDRGKIIRQSVEVTHLQPEGRMERYPSPILFKLVGDKLYMAARRMDDRIFDQEFSFTNGEKSVVLRSPAREEFDIDDFMAWFTMVYRAFNKKKVNDGDKRYRTVLNRSIWKIKKGEEGE